MQMLSMTGFRRVCEEIAPASFVFDTENQPGGTNKDAKLTARYSEALLMMNPNRICFRGEAGALCFNRVKSVRYYDEEETAGAIFIIVCGNGGDCADDAAYTIIADGK